MPELSEQELKVKIKTNFSDAYLLYGEETFLTKTYVDKLVSVSVDEGFSAFNLKVYESEETNLSEIYESCLAVPMMAQSKCVLVKDYPIGECDDKDLNALETLLKENPEDNTLIFAYPNDQPKGKNFNAMVKLFKEYGCVTDFSKKTVSDLAKILESGAKKRGKIFEGGVPEYLINNVGLDLNLLLNELEKVCAYADGNIKKSDVDAVCSKSLEAKVFDMIKDLLSGKFDSAFHRLSKLFDQREDEYMIMGALISQYTDIYRAKAAVKSGAGVGSLSEYYSAYKKGSDFRLNKAATNSNSLSFEQLTECLEILGAADEEMKSSSTDKKQILEQTLVKLTRAGKRK